MKKYLFLDVSITAFVLYITFSLVSSSMIDLYSVNAYHYLFVPLTSLFVTIIHFLLLKNTKGIWKKLFFGFLSFSSSLIIAFVLDTYFPLLPLNPELGDPVGALPFIFDILLELLAVIILRIIIFVIISVKEKANAYSEYSKTG